MTKRSPCIVPYYAVSKEPEIRAVTFYPLLLPLYLFALACSS